MQNLGHYTPHMARFMCLSVLIFPSVSLDMVNSEQSFKLRNLSLVKFRKDIGNLSKLRHLARLRLSRLLNLPKESGSDFIFVHSLNSKVFND